MEFHSSGEVMITSCGVLDWLFSPDGYSATGTGITSTLAKTAIDTYHHRTTTAIPQVDIRE